MEAGRLSALPGERDLSAVGGDRRAQTISLGLMGPHPGVVPFSVAGNGPVVAFAITAEQAGGVVQTTHQPVVAGEVTA